MKGANHSFFSPLMFGFSCSFFAFFLWKFGMWRRVLLIYSRVSWIDKLTLPPQCQIKERMEKKRTHFSIHTKKHPEEYAKNITFGNSEIQLGKISIERWHNIEIRTICLEFACDMLNILVFFCVIIIFHYFVFGCWHTCTSLLLLLELAANFPLEWHTRFM